LRAEGVMGQAASVKLTKRVVEGADLVRGRHYLWDSELRGFGVQIEPTGTKTYFVRYRTNGHGRDGDRRFYKLGRHGDLTPDAARELAKSILGKVAAGEDPAGNRIADRRNQVARRDAITILELGKLFLSEHIKTKRRSKTASTYEILLRLHIGPCLGGLTAESVTRAEITELHLAMRATPANANRVVAVLSSMYSFAAKRGLVPEAFNPARGIEKYREEGRERYLTGDELQSLGVALIEAETVGIPWEVNVTNPNSKHTPKAWKGQRQLTDPYAVAAIRLLLFTSARLREVLDLKWSHVDLERGLLFLPESKTGKKTIVLNGASHEILQQLRAIDAQAQSARGIYVIKTEANDRPRADLKRPWAAIQRHAKLDGVRLHDLRHTFASIGAGASLGLPLVGKLLGHSQPQTTARYAHLDADPLRRAANIIGDQLTAALRGRPAKDDIVLQGGMAVVRDKDPMSDEQIQPLWTDLVFE
jgi:integrase